MPHAFIVAGLPLQVNEAKLRIALRPVLSRTQYLVEAPAPDSDFPTRYGLRRPTPVPKYSSLSDKDSP